MKEHSFNDSKSKCIIKMLEFLIDIFVVFAGMVLQQIVVIPMGTRRALF